MTVTALYELIERLESAHTEDEIHAVCSRLCEQYGFEHFMYGARIPTSFVKPTIVTLSGYPSAWWEHYLDEDYLAVDPVVRHCERHITPIRWDTVKSHKSKNKVIWRLMGEAREYGLRSGISCPMHSAQGEDAMFTCVSDVEPEHARAHIRHVTPDIYFFTAFLHEAVSRIKTGAPRLLSEIKLTPREKQCLLWLAEGKTQVQLADILNISVRTVRFHLKNAALKLGAVTQQQALARAVSWNLVTPQLD